MLFGKFIFFLSLLHLVNPHLQINVHLTEFVNEDNNIQHDCLQIPSYIATESDPREIISYCMSVLPSKFLIQDNNREQKLTFEQLSKEKITNEELYLWSAPIDLIEKYQLYLNQLSKSEETSLGTEIFYNCTLPYFGPKCQYVLQDSKSHNLSLDEIVHDYYENTRYSPTQLTCYMHLECNRGPAPLCLDWREICDGKVDCLGDGNDEEYCWQMEIQQFNEDEYQSSNAACISEPFFRDHSNIYNCDDQFDPIETGDLISSKEVFFFVEPTFRNEEVSCVKYNYRNEEDPFADRTCPRVRINIFYQAMLSIKPNLLSEECWALLKCAIFLIEPVDPIQRIICNNHTVLRELINKTCPDIIYIPSVLILLGHIRIAYNKTLLIKQINGTKFKPMPTYFCYNDQLLYVPDDGNKKILLNNNTCRIYDIPMLKLHPGGYTWIHEFIYPLYFWLHTNTISVDRNSELDKSMMHKCMNSSKHISKYRLLDGVIDCPYEDDENILNKTCPTEENVNYFKCITTNECIPKYLVQDKVCHCTEYEKNICDDEYSDESYSRTTISFQTICDGYSHLSPLLIKYQNETDETNCEQWPRIHIYNRCDGFWDQLDGSDEINCDPSPPLNCPPNNHICVSLRNKQLMCLPIEKANDGNIDCIGAADEPKLCRDDLPEYYPYIFYCYMNDHPACIRSQSICTSGAMCDQKDDHQACRPGDLVVLDGLFGICTRNYELVGSDVAKVLCRRFTHHFPKLRVNFTIDQWSDLIQRPLKQEDSLVYKYTYRSVQPKEQRCHRGLDFQVWLNKEKNLTKNVCLCPPSYYGEICQYQNERVSLTLQFSVTSDSVRTPFIILVSLIDNTYERTIHSSEQFTYLPIKHCRRKFNIYLLYSTRPKDKTKNYSIQIDIYEKTELTYRASFIKSLNFTFLPVHRVALKINIPLFIDDCTNVQCLHGKCLKYFNDRYNRTFCQCKPEWSGRFCSIPYTSKCSSDSLSIGILANNRSLCICPLNKIGPLCLIDDVTCQNTTCFNKGKCISIDQYKTLNSKFVCLCSKEFTGDQCQINTTKLIIKFDQNINLPSLIFIHLIEVKFKAKPVRTTTFKTTIVGQNSIIVYWSLPFHIAFIELTNKTYYLIYLQITYNKSSIIEKTLNSSDQCLNISQLFNQTIFNSPLIHRIKYYHLPCQTINSSELKCFYDEIHLCICQQINQQRVANCFEFNHNMNLYCSSQSSCENDGQCFQEQTACPKMSICKCPLCYYGTRCQLSTTGFSLSLDAILGDHIRPNVKISNQPLIVLISLILTVIITVLGLANGLLSLITFKNKIARESGCGIYLLSSSIITLLTMIIFVLKFLILLLTQMGIIKNRLFLTIQCYSIDFILRFCLTMDQWLTAFVTIERAFIIIKGINFNKNKFKLIAKWIISGLILMAILTNIHDPIYRRLFDEYNNEDDEKRIWCIVQYPSAIRIINILINIIHFILPFIINLISALIIIILTTRQQVKIKKNKKYCEILNEQIQQHKNLLIGPFVLIILGVPRLIISFTSGCLKSSSDTWLFIMGYFISLIPPLLTFILFVLPSSTYKQAFREAISRYRNLIKRRL